jgi:hypothetical protein
MIRLPPIGTAALQQKGLVRMLCAELGEERTPRKLLGSQAIHVGKVLEGGTLSVLWAIPDHARELVSCA